ncbi:hypothetical protein L873DRAFT_1848511 [Choiromyces venosus 120613-1]|uniref:Uncharacterized protein n=1 Tax=Choiromyces venosus 120613-1 TaxID=1336337 RepID=A0A3N4IXW9_9PEZI|nr:hypothetical protein L873DRAFT_1848511 [Choiromyces venosus 120613-1]
MSLLDTPSLPIVILILIFTLIACWLPRRRLPAPKPAHPQPTPSLKASADMAISDLAYTITTLTARYYYMSACLSVANPRIRGLGPLFSEYTTFHINEGVTRDLVDRMIALLTAAREDLEREAKAVREFWEEWVRTSGGMDGGEVREGVRMLEEWSGRRRGAAAREVVVEAEKYFGVDDGVVVAEELTPEEIIARGVEGATGGEVYDGGRGGSRRRRRGG